MMKLRFLLPAALLLTMAKADETTPGAVPAVPAAAGEESWIPHGKELSLTADHRARWSKFLRRQIVEPCRQGCDAAGLAFLETYCDWKCDYRPMLYPAMMVQAQPFQKDDQSPYVRGLAFAFANSTKTDIYPQASQAIETAYAAVVADPQITETAKASLAIQAVTFHVIARDYLDHTEVKRWAERVTRHLLAAWEKKEIAEDEQPFLLWTVKRVDESILDPLVRGIAGKEGNYPWLSLMLKANLAYSRGWAVRGTGTVDTVSEEDMKAYEAQIASSMALAHQAWTLKPQWTESATMILSVGLESGFQGDETARLWFSRAVQARFDTTAPYLDMAWHARPRWGGSHEGMIQFGEDCLNTRRFDTDIPLYYPVMLSEVATEYPYYLFRTPFHKPGVNAKINALYEERLKQVQDLPARHALIAQQVCCNVWCGNHEKAGQLLAQLPADLKIDALFPLPQPRPGHWHKWEPQRLADEIAAYTTGQFKGRLQEMSNALYKDPKQGVELAKALLRDARAAQDIQTLRVATEVTAWSLSPNLTGENYKVWWPPVYAAVAQGRNPELVRQLVAAGEDPDPPGTSLLYYRSPLAIAFSQQKPAMVQVLVELGADAFQECGGPRPQCPFFDSLSFRNMELIKAMVAGGLKRADPKKKESFCQSCLGWAWVARGRGVDFPVLEYIFDNKLIDPNTLVWPDRGWTLLHGSANADAINEVRLCLKYGIDKTIKDKNGKTAQDLAKTQPVRDLIEHGLAQELALQKQRQDAEWLKRYDLNGNGVLDPEERARAQKEAQAGIQSPAQDE